MILINRNSLYLRGILKETSMHFRVTPGLSACVLQASMLSFSVATSIPAQEGRNQYSLFNPTPHEYLREMSTDRPDTTESPYTVDAGHFQLEMSLVDFARDDSGDTTTDTWSVLSSNLKIGLTNQIDVQFVFTPYQIEQAEVAGDRSTVEGFSDDTQIRLKINLWGNDEGDTALAIMPFIKFPTGSDDFSNDHFEGGLIIPFAVSLPNDFSLGLMAEIDYVFDDADHDFGIDFVHTATISHPIAGELSGFIEYVGIAPTDTSKTYQAIASGGLTYAMSDNWIIDCGATAGISDSADDFSLFVGTSIRY